MRAKRTARISLFDPQALDHPAPPSCKSAWNFDPWQFLEINVLTRRSASNQRAD